MCFKRILMGVSPFASPRRYNLESYRWKTVKLVLAFLILKKVSVY